MPRRLPAWPAGADWRLLANPLPQLLLGALGLRAAYVAKQWVELILWSLGAGYLLLYAVYEFWSAWRYLESKPIRRRCHQVLARIATTQFEDDKTLQITIFLANRQDGEPLLVPIVRYEAKNPEEYKVSSKTRFSPHGPRLIREAWGQPGSLFSAQVPSPSFQTDDAARGWYQHELTFSEKIAKKFSAWTLRHVQALIVVAFDSPLVKGQPPIGVVCFSSESPAALEISKPERANDFVDQRKELARHLEVLALMLARMP